MAEAKKSRFKDIDKEKGTAPRNFLKPGVYRLKVKELRDGEGSNSHKNFLWLTAEVVARTSATGNEVGEIVNITFNLERDPTYGVSYGLRDAKQLALTLSPDPIDPEDIDEEFMESLVSDGQPATGREFLCQATLKKSKKGTDFTQYKYARP